MTSEQEVMEFISTATFDQLVRINNRVRSRNNELSRSTASTINVEDKVIVHSQKRGDLEGIVKEVRQKYIIVHSQGRIFKVHASMIEKVN